MNESAKYFARVTTATWLALAVIVLLPACRQRESAATDHGETAKNIVKLTKANFQSEVLSSSQPVLVDFWAVWCGPCKMVAPTVAELATEYEGRLKVGKVNVDDEPALAEQYKIESIPAILIFKGGKLVDQSVGVRSKAEFQAKLNKILGAGAAKTGPSSATSQP